MVHFYKPGKPSSMDFFQNTFLGSSVLTFTLSLFASPVLADPFDSTAREGISLYNQEQYEPAADKFLEAQVNQPESPEVTYNLANSQFRLGRYEDAVKSYDRTVQQSEDPKLQQKAWYNQGNAYYRLGHLDKAIESYKEALNLEPEDRDSKFNLEFSRQQLDKAQQANRIMPRDMRRKKQNPSGPNPPQPEPDQPGAKDKAGDHPPVIEEDPNSQKDQSRTASKDKKNEEESKPAAPNPADKEPENNIDTSQEKMTAEALQQITSMTPQEAEQWLDSLNEDIKKFSRQQMQGKMQDVFVDNSKDW